MEEVSVDLAESLNRVGGNENLLIVQDVLTYFIIIIPLKGKTANEVSHQFLYNVLQNFNIVRVHQDNGACFRHSRWLKLLGALNIEVINSSANNPASRGNAERAVQTVKTLMKKMLATKTSETFDWEILAI